MAEDKLTLDEVRKQAADIGWSLSNEHLEQLVRATRAARARRATLPVATLDPADEPAHVFRLSSAMEALSDARSLTPSPSPERRGEMDGGK